MHGAMFVLILGLNCVTCKPCTSLSVQDGAQALGGVHLGSDLLPRSPSGREAEWSCGTMFGDQIAYITASGFVPLI